MANHLKKKVKAARIAEKDAIENQLPTLRAERRKLKMAGNDYSEVDSQIRQLVKRFHRIDAKLNPKPQKGTGCAIKPIGPATPSAPIYKTYRAASLRPVQGGKTSPK